MWDKMSSADPIETVQTQIKPYQITSVDYIE